MSEVVHVLYCCDQGYLRPSVVSAASLLAYVSPEVEIHIHLFGLGLCEEDRAFFDTTLHRIRHCDIHHQEFPDAIFEGLPKWRGSYGAYLRMLAPEALPELDWVLYLDGDTLFVDDVAKLWTLRDDGEWLQGHPDPLAPQAETGYGLRTVAEVQENYLCSGVLLMHLRELRKAGFSAAWREFLTTGQQPRFVDQSILNVFCVGHRNPLPEAWGFDSREGQRLDAGAEPSLIHFAGVAPWVRGPVSDLQCQWFWFVRKVLRGGAGCPMEGAGRPVPRGSYFC